PIALLRLAYPELMTHREIGLEVRRCTVIVRYASRHEVTGCRVALKPDKVVATFGPLAGRGRTHNRQAGVNRCALKCRLDQAKPGFHSQPLQTIEAGRLGGVRTVRRQRTIVDLPVG